MLSMGFAYIDVSYIAAGSKSREPQYMFCKCLGFEPLMFTSDCAINGLLPCGTYNTGDTHDKVDGRNRVGGGRYTAIATCL